MRSPCAGPYTARLDSATEELPTALVADGLEPE
jgi:hypothetical protein